MEEQQVSDFLWNNELVTWSDDELMTEEVFNVFINAVVEEN